MASTEQHHRKNVLSAIKGSQKKVTVLFTDIEGSTAEWEKRGDLEGRWMVSEHNRLLFPVVRYFRGRVIKTIGDAIMAVFPHPTAATRAAIAMQQILREANQETADFNLKVRIGVHYGKGIVERYDVFGDVVNVAARVEAHGSGGEIWVSRAVKEKVWDKKIQFLCSKKVKAKGKSEELDISSVGWKEHENLTQKISLKDFVPVSKQQKLEILFYFLTFIASIGSMFWIYIRHFLLDFEFLSTLMMNPSDYISSTYVYIFSALIALASLFYCFKRSLPIFWLKVWRGGFFFLITYWLLFGVIGYLPENFVEKNKLNEKVFESKHLLVEVVEPKVQIYSQPNANSEVVKTLPLGYLLLLADVEGKKDLVWNKVFVKSGEYAWVQRVLPAQLGVPEKRLTNTHKFIFYSMDMYQLLISFILALWGALTFRVRPD